VHIGKLQFQAEEADHKFKEDISASFVQFIAVQAVLSEPWIFEH